MSKVVLEICAFFLFILILGCILVPPSEGNETNVTNVSQNISNISGAGGQAGIPKPVIEVSLEELNRNLDNYTNASVRVSGFFGHKKWHGRTGMSYLIRDQEMLNLTKPLPEYSYVRLATDIDESFEGKELVVEGKVTSGTIDYPLETQGRIAIITVENYGVRQ